MGCVLVVAACRVAVFVVSVSLAAARCLRRVCWCVSCCGAARVWAWPRVPVTFTLVFPRPETWWESPHVLEFAAAARDAAAATAATDALCRERWRQHHEGIGERNYTARSRGWQRHFCSKAPFMPPGVPCDARRAGCRDFDGVGADVLTDAGWKTEDVYPGHSKPLLISAGARPGRSEQPRLSRPR